MYKITWEIKKSSELVHKISDVQEISNDIGPDGSILKWLSVAKDLGVIIYSNSIVAYVIYQADELSVEDIKGLVLQGALQQFDSAELIILCEKYDKYVQDICTSLEPGKTVKNLLTYLSTCLLAYKA